MVYFISNSSGELQCQTLLFGILTFDLNVSGQLKLKINKFWWLLKRLRLIKHTLKIKKIRLFRTVFYNIV